MGGYFLFAVMATIRVFCLLIVLCVVSVSAQAQVCSSNGDCPGGFCNKDFDCNGSGFCDDLPEACTFEFSPTCGCDGNVYGNACGAHGEAVSVSHFGVCDDDDSPNSTNDDDDSSSSTASLIGFSLAFGVVLA